MRKPRYEDPKLTEKPQPTVEQRLREVERGLQLLRLQTQALRPIRASIVPAGYSYDRVPAVLIPVWDFRTYNNALQAMGFRTTSGEGGTFLTLGSYTVKAPEPGASQWLVVQYADPSRSNYNPQRDSKWSVAGLSVIEDSIVALSRFDTFSPIDDDTWSYRILGLARPPVSERL